MSDERWENENCPTLTKYLLRHVAMQSEKLDVGPDFKIIFVLSFFLLVFVVAVLLVDRVFLRQNCGQQRRHVVDHVLRGAKDQHFALVRQLKNATFCDHLLLGKFANPVDKIQTWKIIIYHLLMLCHIDDEL